MSNLNYVSDWRLLWDPFAWDKSIWSKQMCDKCLWFQTFVFWYFFHIALHQTAITITEIDRNADVSSLLYWGTTCWALPSTNRIVFQSIRLRFIPDIRPLAFVMHAPQEIPRPTFFAPQASTISINGCHKKRVDELPVCDYFQKGRLFSKGPPFRYEITHWAISRALEQLGGGPRVVVSTAAFHARVRGRFPVSAVWKKQKCSFPIHVWKSVLWGASVTER